MTRLELGGSLWSEDQRSTGGGCPGSIPSWAGDLHGPPCRRSSRADPELPRPERRRSGRRPGGDGPGRRPGGRCRSRDVPRETTPADDFVLLFSESPTRFVLEVPPEDSPNWSAVLDGLPLGRLGDVRSPRRRE